VEESRFLTGTFSINPQKVVHETIDGEAILIHLQSGTYYSLTGVGAEIWSQLDASRSRQQIVADLSSRYSAPSGEVEEAVDELIQELTVEDLLEPSENGAGAKQTLALAPAETNGKAPFVRPELQKFTDMQDFLLVDPIHEVDDAGWPNKKSDA
jgi:hypothetical protein